MVSNRRIQPLEKELCNCKEKCKVSVATWNEYKIANVNLWKTLKKMSLVELWYYHRFYRRTSS